MDVRVYDIHIDNDIAQRVSVFGRVWPIMAMKCMECEYVFFYPLLPEHEPTFCPNCGAKFTSVVAVPYDPGPNH